MAMFNLCVINTTCPICKKDHPVNVRAEDYEAWQNGELVQNAFPYLSAEARELLITGICPDCWDSMFAEDEERYGELELANGGWECWEDE